MEITTVKQKGEGYLLNDTLSVPNDPSNRHYQAIQAWLNEGPGNLIEPEFTAEEIAENEAKAIKDAAKAQARALIQMGQDTLELAVSLLMQYAPISDEQADLNSAALEPIQLLLTNGSLDKALTKVSALDVSTLSYSEADKQEIIDDLTEKLLSLT